MKREVVRDFLNLPGVTGIVLMDDRSRPYFLGVDQTLNSQQKEVLIQGIRHVLGTIAQDFESFEFQFTGRQLYIYKLKQKIVMLVLANGDLDHTRYINVVTSLKTSLENDVTKGIATFRLLASEITLTGRQHLQKQSAEQGQLHTPQSTTSIDVDLNVANGRHPATPATTLPENTLPENVSRNKRLPPDLLITTSDVSQPAEQSPITEQVEDPSPLDSSAPPVIPNQYELIASPSKTIVPPSVPLPSLKEFVTALNVLSNFMTKYLGTAVIVNYWKSSRPDNDWLKSFDIDRTAKINPPTSASKDMNQPISPEQLQLLRKWVYSFMERCTRVIRDLPYLLEQSALTDRQKTILL